MNDLERLARLIQFCRKLNIYFQYELEPNETKIWVGNEMKATGVLPLLCHSIEQIEHYVKREISSKLKDLTEDSQVINERIQCCKAYLHMLG